MFNNFNLQRETNIISTTIESAKNQCRLMVMDQEIWSVMISLRKNERELAISSCSRRRGKCWEVGKLEMTFERILTMLISIICLVKNDVFLVYQ